MTPARPSRLPERLGDSVLHELDRLGGAPAGAAGLAAALRAWPQAVGETIARNAWPARFARDGTLVVHTTSSTWAFELTHLAESVRGRLGPAAPPRLSFVVGPVPEAGAESVPEGRRETAAADAGDAAKARRLTAEIADPELREAVAKAAAASLARARRAAGPTDPSGRL